MHSDIIPHDLAGEESYTVGVRGDLACVAVGLLVAVVLASTTFAAVLGLLSSMNFLASVLLVMCLFSIWAIGGSSDDPSLRHA